MMEIDRYLSFATRRLPKFKGMPRLVKPLRAFFANKYRLSDSRWVLFEEYEMSAQIKVNLR